MRGAFFLMGLSTCCLSFFFFFLALAFLALTSPHASSGTKTRTQKPLHLEDSCPAKERNVPTEAASKRPTSVTMPLTQSMTTCEIRAMAPKMIDRTTAITTALCS